MILMAFLAVIREGIETVVFLLAAFNESGSGAGAGIGALLGLLVAVGLGYGIYRGGVRLNLSRFFRATGLVLVLVAAGLVVNALHTAHEAGWLQWGQGRTLDLTWLVEPGTVQASLLTGMLGIQPRPVLVEVLAWIAYLVPVACYVAWPPGRAAPTRTLVRVGAATAVLAAVAAAVLAVLAPARPGPRPVTADGSVSARVLSVSGGQLILRVTARRPGAIGSGQPYRLISTGSVRRAGVNADVYRRTTVSDGGAGRPRTLSLAEIARANGGRLPIGLGSATSYPVTYRDATTVTATVEPRTNRVLELAWSQRTSVVVRGTTLAVPVADTERGLPRSTTAAAEAAARKDADDLARRAALIDGAAALGVVALLVALASVGSGRGRASAGRRGAGRTGPSTRGARSHLG